ncbi:hypothetical protein B484DRAFT_170084 [Ochromonadaceae sp. CCMP2298]|nr:hypothetical protein B484DRAFT_170084 [Ochromonadaceae sp. CCMP2298]
MTGSGSSTNKTRKKSMLKAHCPCGSKTSIKNVPSFLTHLAATPCDCGTGSAHRSSTWWKRHPRAVLQAEAMGCTLLHDKVTFEAMGKEDRDTRDQTGSCKLLARHLHMRCKTCEEDEWNISVSRLMAARAGTRTQTRLKCRCNPGYVGEQFTLTVPSRNGILAAR